MKTISIALALAGFGLDSLPAQTAQTTTAPVSATSVDTGFAVSERGPHHRVWSSVTWSTDSKGRPVAQTNSFIELATGLHFVNEKGEWEESSDEITILPDGKGAAAAKGQIKVIFPPDVFDGQIQMNLPDGKWLVSRVLGLSYRDSASGRSVLIAETTNSVGELQGRNVVIYPDALNDDAGFQASIRYKFTRDGFEQDVILTSGLPPMPEEFGLSRDTTVLEVLTEWFNPQSPVKSETTIVSKSGEEIIDERLDFGGVMEMGTGKAFSQGLESDEEAVPVTKQWLKMEGRDFLIEQVRFNDILPSLEKLPKADGAGLLPKANPTKRLASIQRKLPAPPRMADSGVKTKAIRQAMISRSQSGFVLDYVIFNTSLTNQLFQGDTTYYLSGNVSLNGTNNTFEAGTILKYTNNVVLTVNTPVTWLGDSYRPVLLISKDDNTAGEVLPGSTGNPGTSLYAANALYFNAASANTSLVLQNLRIANATRALSINTKAGHVVKNLQLVNCANGLSLTNAEVSLRNALMFQVQTNFTGSSSTGRVEHLTSDISSRFNQNIGSNLFVTNSLLVQMTNPGTFTSFNNRTNSAVSGIFQTIGAGSHYLATSSTNRDVGTTNINAILLADLKKLTTFPPVIITNITITVSTNWNPQAQRDTGTNDLPDIGFHYDPIDYALSGVSVTNSTLTLSNGVALGIFGSSATPGIVIRKDGNVISEGAPTNLNQIARYNAVQEQANTNWSATTVGHCVNLVGNAAKGGFRFTRWSLPGGRGFHFESAYPGSLTTPVGFKDCQFGPGSFEAIQCAVAITNCLFERPALTWDDDGGDYNYSAFNNLYKAGSFTANKYDSTDVWLVKDNLFDGTSITLGGGQALTHDYNGYVTNANRITPNAANDKILTNSPIYQTGYLGRFYYPTNGGLLSNLINAGSRNATNAGLYHYTVTTNQVKETNSTVDIGFHFVAVYTNGSPVDTDGDGAPDYLEDANGNGVRDGSETDWASFTFSKGVNLAGNAVVIDDQTWLSDAAARTAGMTVQNGVTNTRSFTPSPTPPDVGTTTMLQSMITRRRLPLIQDQQSTKPTFKYERHDNDGSGISWAYRKVTMNSFPTNVDFSFLQLTQQYQAWCIEFPRNDVPNASNTVYNCYAIYSYNGPVTLKHETTNMVYTAQQMNKVNYILNNRGAAALDDVQFSIWSVLGQYSWSSGLTTNANNNPNFVPDPNATNQVVGVIVQPTNSVTMQQSLIIEVPLNTNKAVGFTINYPVQNGSNTAYLWLAESESDHVRKLNLKVEGTIISTNAGDLSTNQWQKLGPYTANVTDSNLTIDVSSPVLGDPVLMGFALYVSPPATSNQPPSVIITNPVNNAVFNFGVTITNTAVATDSDGSITNVQFFNGTNSIGNVTTGGPAYKLNWTNAPVGTNVLTAVAKDNGGLSTTSAPVTVIVSNSFAVKIMSPASGFNMLSRDTAAVSAWAVSTYTNLQWIQFFESTNNIGYATGLGTNGYYNIEWTPVAGGTYSLTAKAVDARGSNVVSLPVTVNVRARPIVTITNPVNQATLGPSLFNVSISANATANGASVTITNVAYYNGTNLIGSSTTGPSYTITWNSVNQGTYTLLAKGSDSLGAAAFSHPVEIAVQPPNVGPSVNAGPDMTVHVGETNLLAGTVSDDGLPTNYLASGWSRTSGTGTVTFGNTNLTSTTVVFNQVGTQVLQLKATDGPVTNSDSVTIVVLPANQPPIVNPGTNQLLYDKLIVPLAGYAGDDGQPSGGTLISNWRLVSGPGSFTVADPSRTNSVAVFGAYGIYLLELSASDGEFTTSSNVVVTLVASMLPYKSPGYQYQILPNTNTNDTSSAYQFYYENFLSNATVHFVTNYSVFTNQFQAFYTNFYALNFDASSFSNGTAAFANTNNAPCLPYPPTTVWPEFDSIMIRKPFVVPAGTTNLSIAFGVDDGLVVFMNGQFLFERFFNYCPDPDSVFYNDVPGAFWHEGTNLLVVWAYDKGGQAFLDVKIGANQTFSLPQSHSPTVTVAGDQVVSITNAAHLSGLVTDPDIGGYGDTYAYWTANTGPGYIIFSIGGLTYTNGPSSYDEVSYYTNSIDMSAEARFSTPGDYQMCLYTDGGQYACLNVTVLPTNAATPTLVLTSPTNNASYPADVVVPVSATATPVTGTITNLEFIASSTNGTYLIGRSTNASYAFNWVPGIGGTYTLTAQAFDDAGRMGVSSTVVIQVIPITAGNHSPKANNDSPVVLANSVNNLLYVLNNDTDEDGDSLTITEIIPSTKAQIVPGGKAISYTPPANIQGYPADGFSYRISDGRGGTALGGVLMYVYASPPPVVSITAPPTGYATNAGATVPITANIAPSQFVTKVEFVRNGFVLGTVTNGSGGNYTLNWPATFKNCQCGITATAYDAFGQAGTSDPIYITVTNVPGNGNPTSDVVTYTNSTGSFPFTNGVVIRDGLLGFYGRAFHSANSNVVWQLDLSTPDGTLIRTLTNGTVVVGSSSVSNFLAGADFTTLENGVYDLKLTVTGGYVETNVTTRFILDSQLKIGQFSFSQQDLVIPVNGIPLTVVRTYNSLNPRLGDFGYSWTYAINSMDVVLDEQREQTQGWSDDDDTLADAEFSMRVGGGRDVTLTLPDGQRTTFYFSLEHGPSVGGIDCFCYQAKWTPPPGVTAKLETTVDNTLYAIPWGGPTYWQAGGPGVPMENFDFPAFVLTTVDGTRYNITREDTGSYVVWDHNSNYTVQTYGSPKLTSIVQRSNDRITINPDSIVHTNPTNGVTRRVVFQRRDDGLISGISDPNGLDAGGNTNGPLAVQYQYDATGNLVNVLQLVTRSPATYVTNTFTYGLAKYPHYITGIVDPRGITVARNEYDDSGRLTAVVDADGKRTEFGHDTTGKFERVIDRVGNTNTVAYDLRGNVTATTNALGQITTMAYDNANNKTNEVAFLNGQPYATNTYVYGSNNLLLASINALGHSNVFTYNSYGQVLVSLLPCGCSGATNYYNDTTGQLIASSDALGNTTSNYFGASGLLLGTRDPLGTVTTNFNDALGNLTATAVLDASGKILSTNSFIYDLNGNQINSVIWRTNRLAANSWLSATNTTVYDAQNRVVQTIAPDGGTNSVVYNALGKQDYTVDAMGRTNRFDYDLQGRVFKTIAPDSLFEISYFDAEGRVTNRVDRASRSNISIFDALGRMTQTIYADNTTNRTYFDDLGRVKWSVDARGVTNAFGYDVQGRRVAMTNAWGTSVAVTNFFGYDVNGNQPYITNALGVVTTNVFDALNRVTQMQLPDGTKTFSVYDAVGRHVAETNQDGVVTRFGYDGAGRLIAVTNAFGVSSQQTVTRYEYDEAGSQTAQIDAMLRTNRYAFDSMGRRVTHTVPDTTRVETFGYDLGGNLIRHTNFNGVVITNHYDVLNRLTNRSSVNGYTISYAYSVTGQRTNMTDASGTTSYAYDIRDRLTNKVVTWTGGPTISLNYRHNANGNLTNCWSSTTSGVTNFYQYDPLNRLTNVLGRDSVSSGYKFDGVGNLQTISYGNGVTNLYQYDRLNRLTNTVWRLNASTLGSFYYKLGLSGMRTNLDETLNGTRSYAWKYDALYRMTNENISAIGGLSYNFDAVGNRTNRTSTVSGIANQTPTYNTNDWLTTDTYDNNGNTTESSGAAYQYDVENRLTNANSGAVLIAYSGDGARVKKTVGTTTTYYLVDDRTPSGYPQVVEEHQSVGGGAATLTAVYTYGLDLITQRRSGAVRYFCYDGHGSTRLLTDTSGTVTDTYLYDAYGTKLSASTGTTPNNYLYCGEQFDNDMGFYYLRSRYYKPDSGRFWTKDTHEGNNQAPLSLQKYLYCHANPANYVDPSGLYLETFPGDPNTFWEKWTEKQREAWFKDFREKLGPTILEAAKAHNVPKELLAAIIANEMIDYSLAEYRAEVYGGFGKSVGPAQITAGTVLREGFDDLFLGDFRQQEWAWESDSVPDQPSEEYIRAQLVDKKVNIDIAARLLESYLKTLCLAATSGKITRSFQRDVAGGCGTAEFCVGKTKSGDAIVNYHAPKCLIQGLAAVWNNGPKLITDVSNIPKQSRNAYIHGLNAGELYGTSFSP